jgi:hypothetical protein
MARCSPKLLPSAMQSQMQVPKLLPSHMRSQMSLPKPLPLPKLLLSHWPKLSALML